MKYKALNLIGGVLNPRAVIAGEQKGQALIYVIIILSFGMMVLSGFLSYTGTMVGVRDEDMDLLEARYAADTGITEVISDLNQGEDVLDSGYTVPTPEVNGYSVDIDIDTPAAGTEPAAVYHYIDPGADWGLESLDSQDNYLFVMDNVQAGSDIQINWAFTPNDEAWKIRLYEGLGPLEAPAPITIAEDDFESGGWSGGTGWLWGWWHEGEAAIETRGTPYEGTYHLRLRGSRWTDGYVDRAVDLLGATDARLQFWAKADSLELGETATCSVSPNGSDWYVLKTWVDGDDDDTYHYWDFDLSSYSMTSEFYIAFAIDGSGTGDYFYVDDINIVAQAVPPAVVENSDTKGPGILFADGSLITGGQYTIEFINDSGVSLVSADFSSDGSAGNTWIYAQAHKDYLITSTAGDSTVIAYVRQIPGITDPVTRQDVYIQSWKEP